jgi:hypothetical protein
VVSAIRADRVNGHQTPRARSTGLIPPFRTSSLYQSRQPAGTGQSPPTPPYQTPRSLLFSMRCECRPNRGEIQKQAGRCGGRRRAGDPREPGDVPSWSSSLRDRTTTSAHDGQPSIRTGLYNQFISCSLTVDTERIYPQTYPDDAIVSIETMRRAQVRNDARSAPENPLFTGSNAVLMCVKFTLCCLVVEIYRTAAFSCSAGENVMRKCRADSHLILILTPKSTPLLQIKDLRLINTPLLAR